NITAAAMVWMLALIAIEKPALPCQPRRLRREVVLRVILRDARPDLLRLVLLPELEHRLCAVEIGDDLERVVALDRAEALDLLQRFIPAAEQHEHAPAQEEKVALVFRQRVLGFPLEKFVLGGLALALIDEAVDGDGESAIHRGEFFAAG